MDELNTRKFESLQRCVDLFDHNPLDIDSMFYWVKQYFEILDSSIFFTHLLLSERQKYESQKIEKRNIYSEYIELSEMLENEEKRTPWIASESLRDFHRKLDFLVNKQCQVKTRSAISYSSTTHILTVNDIPVKICKRKEPTNQARILSYIFSNKLGDEIDYKDIIDNALDKEANLNWNTCYTACRSLNEKIRKESGYGEFLEYTSSSGHVRINPKYIP